ncbi:MAG: hypothetical protein NZ455_11235 [Bacteroidia bacterium]|nr:hypothetical protein [Bacteroidia bacterium]MDW8347122.1 hypothetical protein [Bacteroidia bacterium]
MPLGSAERSEAPSVSAVRNSPTRSASEGTRPKNKLDSHNHLLDITSKSSLCC